MKTDTIIKDYYGGLYYIEQHKDRELTIFIVDDQEIYSSLLKDALNENPNFSIHVFDTGEKALEFLALKPDLVILDYHLDGKYHYAQKGDVIYGKIKEQLPLTEVVMVSSDHKLAFISGVQKKNVGIMYKDGYTVSRLKEKTKAIFGQKKIHQHFSQFVLAGLVVCAVIFTWFLFK